MVRDSTGIPSNLHQIGKHAKKVFYRVRVSTETLLLAVIHDGYPVMPSGTEHIGTKGNLPVRHEVENHCIAMYAAVSVRGINPRSCVFLLKSLRVNRNIVPARVILIFDKVAK